MNLFIALLCSGCILLIVAALVLKFFITYSSEISSIKRRISKAEGWDEYVHWRKELRVVYLCVIPGLTPKKIGKIARWFKHFSDSKAEKKEKSDGLTSLLLPSVLGIFVCCICLAGGTYAWFSASQTAPTTNIQIAKYTVIDELTFSEVPVADENGIYKLQAGKTYELKLTADGNATTGYCELHFGAEKVITQHFPSKDYDNETITVTLVIIDDIDLTIVPQWGTSSSTADKLDNGETYTYEATVIE